MAERVGLSKKLRFEVFKRDKFTCQYCGKKAPDVVLNVDHINPVAAGGENDIINLVTSCFDCNNGKSDRLLDDNTVVEKQRRQLEMLQERREQIEMMFEWKKSLEQFDNDVEDMVAKYVNSKMPPLVLNETGKSNIPNWLKRFTLEQILDGIDGAAKTYLRRNADGSTEQDSAELFLTKIGGVISVNQMSPIKKKLAYIKGIARNRFGYWDDRKGSVILGAYVNAMEEYGWDEKRILDDLEVEVIPKTKEVRNWSEWRNLLEGWTEDIKRWKIESSPSAVPRVPDEVTEEDARTSAGYQWNFLMDRLEALIYIGRAFPNFREAQFREEFLMTMDEFLEKQIELYSENPQQQLTAEVNQVDSFVYTSSLPEYFDFSEDVRQPGMLHVLNATAGDILVQTFDNIYFPGKNYSRKFIDFMLAIQLDTCQSTLDYWAARKGDN